MASAERIVDLTVGRRQTIENVRSAISMVVSSIDTDSNVWVTCEYLDGGMHQHGPFSNSLSVSVGDEVLMVMDQYDSWWMVAKR
jgi:hypothetical protein